MLEITEEERIRAVERSRRMYLTDTISNFATAWDKGVRIGLEKRLRKGLGEDLWKRIKEGDRAFQIELAKAYLDSDIPLYIVADVLGLPRVEMNRLCAENAVDSGKGSHERDVVIAENLIRMGFSTEQITEALDLSVEEVERLRAEN